MYGTEGNGKAGEGRADQLSRACQRHADEPRVRDCEHGICGAMPNRLRPSAPAAGGHRDGLTAAGTVLPHVGGPGVQFIARYRLPGLALPGAEAQFDQIVADDGLARVRELARELETARCRTAED